MDEKLDKKLVEEYPKIFQNRNASLTETAMCWGFDCGNGWYWLIDKLCDTIQEYINLNNVEQVIATQVKEKYGGLRFYYTGGDETIEGMIWLAEFLSFNICEECGSTEEVTQIDTGWTYTRCKNCKEKL